MFLYTAASSASKIRNYVKMLNLSYALYGTVYRAICVPTSRKFFVALYEFAFYGSVLYWSPLYYTFL